MKSFITKNWKRLNNRVVSPAIPLDSLISQPKNNSSRVKTSSPLTPSKETNANKQSQLISVDHALIILNEGSEGPNPKKSKTSGEDEEIIEVEEDLDLNKSELERLDSICKTTEIGFSQLAQNIPKPKVLSISSANTISAKNIQHKTNTNNLMHNLQNKTKPPTPGHTITPQTNNIATNNDQSKINFDHYSDNSSSSISSSQPNVIQQNKVSNMTSSNDSNDGTFSDSFSHDRDASNSSPYY